MITPDMKEFWNERYSAREYSYGTEPNTFFKAQLETLKPGTVLLPGDGEGRNSVYAAVEGWEVWAFDQSEVGKKKALSLAADNNVNNKVHYEVCDVDDFHPEQSFDLVASIYFHLPPPIRRKFHRNVLSWLKPGGIYLIEAFRPEQVLNQRNTGGPKKTELMETCTELHEMLGELEILQCEDITLHLSEGIHHDGEADILRFVGKKKEQHST